MTDTQTKVDRALEECGDYDDSDFVALALACLDQAGMKSPDMMRIDGIVRAALDAKGA